MKYKDQSALFMKSINKRRMQLGLDEILHDEKGRLIRLNKKGKFVRA